MQKMRLSIGEFTLELSAGQAQPLLLLMQEASAQLAAPPAPRIQLAAMPDLWSTVRSVN
jgi:hypothetical protein